MDRLRSITMPLPGVLAIFAIGSVLLTAMDAFLLDGPLAVLFGSLLGVAYAIAMSRWWAGQGYETKQRLNPHTRWPDTKSRNLRVIPAMLIWFALLFAAFTFLPDYTQPALGAFNVVALWLIAMYAYNPPMTVSAEGAADEAADGSPTRFDWFGYFFQESQESHAPVTQVNMDGTIRGRRLPLDAMQAAWEEEQAYLAEYRAAGISD